ncbi:hypothetical protein BY996DRAFT_6624309 [Phakopsora pachyrhizi]|nr:hypothetical protein BY996DRAFT_6624309 [Phakopsora pachyrhizi]
MLEFRMLFSINAITGSSMNKLWQGEITLDSAATEITSSNIGLLVNCTALEKLIPIYSATDTDSGHALVGTVDEVKNQIELLLLGSSKGRIQLVVLRNLHLKFRNKERTKEIQDLSQSLDMTNDDSREKQEGTH